MGRLRTARPAEPGAILPPSGKRVTYDELLAAADPSIARQINEETFIEKFANIQAGLDELNTRFSQVNPDVVVMFGDDQSEFFFDDNYPSINVYWGDTIKMLPRTIRADMSRPGRWSSPPRPTATRSATTRTDSKLGLHIIESLMDQDFDVSQTKYIKEAYGGSIGPATWYLDNKRETQPRPFGLPHAFAFPIVRWFDGKTPADRADHDQHLLPAELDQPEPRLRARPRRPQGRRGVGHATRRVAFA